MTYIIDMIREYKDSSGMNPFILTRKEAKEIIAEIDELNETIRALASGLHEEQKG